MRTARTYLPTIHELHSLRWIIETGQEHALKQTAAIDLGRLASARAAISEFHS